MPKLTPRQEHFAREASGNISQAEAFRRAYRTEKMSDKTIMEKASRLAADGKIRARIEEHRQMLADKALWTREIALSMLVEIASTAKANTTDELLRYNAPAQTVAIRAIEQANKMCGYHEPVKIEHSGDLRVTLAGELDEWAK